MLETGTPRVFIKFMKNGDDTRGDEFAVLDIAAFKKIDFDSAVAVSRVEETTSLMRLAGM